MKDLINKLQKDLNQLQKTLQQEGGDLIQKIANVDLKENLKTTRKDIEKIIELKIKGLNQLVKIFLKRLRKMPKKQELI